MKIGDLKPQPNNPRKISAGQLEKLCESIKRDPEFMRLRPIVIDREGVIIGGNQRWKACKKLGMKELPDGWVARADDLTDEQRRRFVLVDNAPVGMAGEWDMEILDKDWSVDERALAGFAVPEFGEKGEADAEPQVDRAAELNKKWGVKTGDLWLVGEHRLLCGDSTSEADVGRLLGDRNPVLMVTDPPYGVEYDPAWRAEAGVNKNTGKMGKVANDDRADWREAWALFPGDVAYVWHASMMTTDVVNSLESIGFERRSMIIWNKDRFTLGRGHYHWRHEPAWYCVRKGGQGHWAGGRDQDSVWNIKARDDSGVGHGTQKPLECMARPMRNHDAPEVYDPFLGSGTTMVAGQNLGRKVYGLEISPGYCAVILERMATAFPDLKIEAAPCPSP